MKLLNLTPHPISIVAVNGDTVNLPVDGPAPRLDVAREMIGEINGIGVARSTMGEPAGLPAPQGGVIVIVSALVAEHPSVAHRADLAYPGEAIRDDSGRIVGAKGLCAGPGLAVEMGGKRGESPLVVPGIPYGIHGELIPAARSVAALHGLLNDDRVVIAPHYDIGPEDKCQRGPTGEPLPRVAPGVPFWTLEEWIDSRR